MTEALDNAGARLLAITRRLKDFTSKNSPPLFTWGGALGIQTAPPAPMPAAKIPPLENGFEVIYGIYETRKLISEVERQLSSIEDVKIERFLGTLSRLQAASDIKAILGDNYYQVISAISDGDLTILEFCADILERHYREPVIEVEELRKLRDALDELFDEVTASEIQPDLKTFLLSCIEEMRRGVVEYQIGGHKKLKETLGKTFGAILVNHDIIKANRDEPALMRFEFLTGRLASLVSFTSDVASLVESAVKLLPGG